VKRRVVLLALLVFAVPASAAHLPILASQDAFPTFAPDGRHVAFSVIVNGQGRAFELDVVDAQTKRVRTIGHNAGSPSASWSSDNRIAWTSGGILYTANADGTGKRRYLAPKPSYAPAWRPHSAELAYLTAHGAVNLDLWVAGALWAKDAIGVPSWSPDGTSLAFAREGEIAVATGPGQERSLAATVGEPSAPVFSPDGTKVAYAAAGRVYVVPADGSSAPALVAGPFGGVTGLAWAPASDVLAYSVPAGLELTTLVPVPHSQLFAPGAAAGASFSPTDPHGDVLAFAGPVSGCPGHHGIRIYGQGLLAGTCAIDGTPGPDVIEGTQSWGDVIRAGAGNDRIHAGDRHTDRIDCGSGRDTVWADKVDKLTGCEIVHR